MKPLSAHVLKKNEEIFKLVERRLPFFDAPFHFHNECEIVYIVKGNGKRIIGDSIDTFKEGELVFLGNNLPHIWSSDNANKNFHSIVIFFNDNALFNYLSGFENVSVLQQLFSRAKRGLIANQNIPSCLINKILSMPYADNFRKMIDFLEIIDFFSKEENAKPLASDYFINEYEFKTNIKIDEVINFCVTHYKEEITLKQVADICHLTPPSFCRYFKAHTKATFLEFLNEIKVGNAKKKLIENDRDTIFKVAIESGFKNLSNFNKIFKAKTGVTPKDYRKNFDRILLPIHNN